MSAACGILCRSMAVPTLSDRHVYAVIPTFNEEKELSACLASLEAQEGVTITAIVANAGEPLSRELAARCHEIQIDGSNFWTGSTQAGFDEALRLSAEIVLQSNADIKFLPGSVARLVDALAHSPGDVFGSPGYVEQADGRLKLQFSRDVVIPFLLHNFLRRDWIYAEDAPAKLLASDMAGQGIVFHTDWLRKLRLRDDLFPMYRGDHTFWLKVRKMGGRIWVVGRAGIVNQRPLSGSIWAKGFTLRRLWWYLTSPYSPDSVPAMWRYRRENLFFPFAVVSFTIMCPGTWIYRAMVAAARTIARTARGSAGR